MLKGALIAWNELVFKYQDIFNPKSLYLIIHILEKKQNDDLVLLVLQHLKYACVLHELNRQNIINANIMKYLKPLLHGYSNEVGVNATFLLLKTTICILSIGWSYFRLSRKSVAFFGA